MRGHTVRERSTGHGDHTRAAGENVHDAGSALKFHHVLLFYPCVQGQREAKEET